MVGLSSPARNKMIDQTSTLILTHFVSDFFLQPGDWAINKVKFFKPLLFHSIQYTLPFFIVFYLFGINMIWGLLIFGSHLAIDNRKALEWWNRVVKKDTVPEWVLLVQDQVLHLIIVAIIIVFS